MTAHMELDQLIDQAIALTPRGRRGAPSSPPSFLREIAPEDEVALAGPYSDGVGAGRALTRIRQTHHMAARLLAEGRREFEVAAITGYTPQRITLLKSDPAFANLVSEYKNELQAKYLNVHERLANLGVAITDEFLERLENAPESIPESELREWAKLALDRGGYGPKSTRDVNVRSESAVLHLVEQIKAERQETTQVKLLEG
jgi:hypothetical protein